MSDGEQAIDFKTHWSIETCSDSCGSVFYRFIKCCLNFTGIKWLKHPVKIYFLVTKPQILTSNQQLQLLSHCFGYKYHQLGQFVSCESYSSIWVKVLVFPQKQKKQKTKLTKSNIYSFIEFYTSTLVRKKSRKDKRKKRKNRKGKKTKGETLFSSFGWFSFNKVSESLFHQTEVLLFFRVKKSHFMILSCLHCSTEDRKTERLKQKK